MDDALFSLDSLPNFAEYYRKQGSDRGERTWKYDLPDGKQIMLFRRLKGEPFGAHFHKGEDPSKNPEIFLLLEGKIQFSFVSKEGKKAGPIVLDATSGKPQLLRIQPWAFHFVEALTDVLFIEYRLTPFDPEHPDTFPAKDFSC